MTSKSEIWKAHPEYAGIEVSTFGNVRSLDKMVWNGWGTYLKKGRILKPFHDKDGYLGVCITINGKQATKKVHRLTAQTFIQNPDSLPQVNHKNCNRADNRVSNLEWCTASYNRQYQENFGISSTESKGRPLFAVNLETLEVLHFRSQSEAGRELGVNNSNISAVIKGKYKQTNGYYFKEDDGNGIEIDKDKIKSIVDGMPFTGGVFAVNLNTLEVSRLESQMEASRVLGVYQQNISHVIKGKLKSTGGYWFVNDDKNAADAIKRKLNALQP